MAIPRRVREQIARDEQLADAHLAHLAATKLSSDRKEKDRVVAAFKSALSRFVDEGLS